MNTVARFSRLALSYLLLHRLNRKVAAGAEESSRLITETFSFCGGSLEPIQVKDEIARLVTDVRRLKPERILEIGTAKGGTLYLWTRVACEDATIVSVDLPGGKFGGGYSSLRIPLYKRFAQTEQSVHLIRASSHAPETLSQVRGLFGNAQIDFLFLDGDHTYEGVRDDWEMYGPLVRPGGLVAFHDVAMNYDDTQVKRLWDELKGKFSYREYLFNSQGLYGIGVLEMPASS
jgi:predicted O-methyltransferase YrrM